MKKILLLTGVLLCGSLAMAQIPSQTITAPDPKTQTTVVIDEKVALEEAMKNIDRRLAYFNRFKQSGDIESLAKLISEKNKEFNTIFINYVKLSPAFTIKRNTATKITKTPTNEYFVPSILTIDGKEKKVSITFVEEKSAQGSKWLIANSTFHTPA